MGLFSFFLLSFLFFLKKYFYAFVFVGKKKEYSPISNNKGSLPI